MLARRDKLNLDIQRIPDQATESQAAATLVEAAQTLAADPRAMQLRYLQTLADIAGDGSSTIVFPLPMDLIGPLLERGPGVIVHSQPRSLKENFR